MTSLESPLDVPQLQNLPLAGVIVPLITPLLPTGAVDKDSFASLVDHVVAAGVTGCLALGSSGESGALSESAPVSGRGGRRRRERLASDVMAGCRRSARTTPSSGRNA